MTGIKKTSVLEGGPKVVATVHSPAALRCALRLKAGSVDFLEVRVDSFAGDPQPLLRALPRLGFPLIITVRHPAEGGAQALGFARRSELFAQFLPAAALIDLEFRSLAKMAATVEAARALGVGVIVSDHHFRSTPAEQRLRHARQAAATAGADVFKVAALTETPAALARLLTLFTRPSPVPLSAMGMGRFGKVSRLLFAQAGSVLNYGYLDQPNAPGQWEAVLLRQRLRELE